ncbi:hypothetical protein H9651_05480 [Microbacterium sp. Sa4CUA7]|uniref:Integral membrane protein n=1 Tax=Microbacterium pullorum TaxID=2762236 RepID=A0ABR8S154_9MICO|nr:hypothetical protein [Microbacterium pullorum]MBD7957079.1 hypothetical protein [Microbacterium pullorum]
MTTRQSRALRGTAAATIATLVAATAHTLSGGGAPHPLLLIAVAALAAPPAVWLAGRRAAWWRTAGVVAGAQALFHGAFALVGDAHPLPSSHAHHRQVDIASLPPLVMIDGDATMTIGHLLAALVTILAVLRGEQLVRRIARGLRRHISRLAVTLPSPIARPRPLTVCQAPRRVRRTTTSALSRRGPPVLAG